MGWHLESTKWWNKVNLVLVSLVAAWGINAGVGSATLLFNLHCPFYWI